MKRLFGGVAEGGPSPSNNKRKKKRRRRKSGISVASAYSSSSTSSSSSPSSSAASSDGEPSRRAQLCKMFLDLLLFYTTAFFVLLAIFSAFALIFLVPFFIDPAWSTLSADFDPEGTNCTTVLGVYREGKSQCTWSSCEEGCTKTVYTCWQVQVEYELPRSVAVGQAFFDDEDDYVFDDEREEYMRRRLKGRRRPRGRGRLFPNVKGCGYPPRTVCSSFISSYARNGSEFRCFVSRADPALVIVDLDLEQVRRDLFYSLAIPVPCLLVSIAYVVVAYLFIYTDPPEKSYRPVATLSTAGAMAALIDVRALGAGAALGAVGAGAAIGAAGAAGINAGNGAAEGEGEGPDAGGASSEEAEQERQRKMLLLQAQRAKLLATQQASNKTTAFMIRSAVASATASAVSLPEATKKEADEEDRRRKEKTSDNLQFEKVQKYRKEYGQEKYSVMQYYQYYGIL